MSVGGDHAAADAHARPHRGGRVSHARPGSVPEPRGEYPLGLGTCDPGEFRDYVAARSATLLRMAYLLTGHRADAEDLVQVALAKTYLAWSRIQDRRALDGYVRRAMVNTHISWWRRRRLEEYPTDHIPEQAVDDHAAESGVHDALWRALARLPPRMRAAITLRFYEDMSEAEIAVVLGVSVGTVKSTIYRAVAKLRIDTELLCDFGDHLPRGSGSVGPDDLAPTRVDGAARGPGDGGVHAIAE